MAHERFGNLRKTRKSSLKQRALVADGAVNFVCETCPNQSLQLTRQSRGSHAQDSTNPLPRTKESAGAEVVQV